MSLRTGARPRRLDPLQKKVARNPKYENVLPTINTGASVTSYMRRLQAINEFHRYRKDELFRRMKVSTFVQLILQVFELDEVERELHSIHADSDLGNDAETHAEANKDDRGLEQLREQGGQSEVETSRSRTSLQSVISGLGEMDIRRGRTLAASPLHFGLGSCRDHNRTSTEWWKLSEDVPDPPVAHSRSMSVAVSTRSTASTYLSASLSFDLDTDSAAPYLLLDVRNRDDYEASHLRTAVSYPATMVSRSVNSELPIMRAYRNMKGRIIVVYDNDETLAPEVASALVQRGYDNLFMLSGGLKLALKLFPDGLLATGVDQSQPGFDAESIEKLRAASDALASRSNKSSTYPSRTTSRGSINSLAGRSTRLPSQFSSSMSSARTILTPLKPFK